MAALSRDGKTLYFAGNMGDIHRRDLFKVATRGGNAQQLTKGAMLETYPAALASDRQVAVLLAGPSLPQSVALVPSNGGEGRAIVPLPQRFPKSKHVVPENVTLKAADGFEFHNQIFLPPDLKPGERRPAMIFIHGGSRRQMLLGYHYMHFYHMAYAMNQYFANKGYVVLSVNYRSGIGYGKAFRDTPGIGRRGNKEYADILAAGLYLQGRTDVDPKRVGLWGLSYGGILTAQGLARNSDVFAAGVDIAGAHFWGEALDPDVVTYSSSSASEVDKWTSPVLLIQGDDDRNVDFSQTVGLVQALRANDVYFELIVYPDEVHDFLVFSRWLETFGATDDFFDRFLWNKKD
jgi:dipeptidyl aminopeptidase/acylaminoacyl peptidase